MKSSNETSVLYLSRALFRNDGVCAERRPEVVSEWDFEDAVSAGISSGVLMVVALVVAVSELVFFTPVMHQRFA